MVYSKSCVPELPGAYSGAGSSFNISYPNISDVSCVNLLFMAKILHRLIDGLSCLSLLHFI